MVAVRMVSEGVDVPRLAVGVYATTTATPLFFAQAVGRFVRARNRGETASVFLPSVPTLLGFASELEAQRDHVLGRTITDEDDIFAAERDLLAAGAAPARAPPRSWSCPLPGARVRGPLRPRALRRRRRSATRARCTSGPRRRWTSSASPACSSPTRCASCSTSGRASARAADAGRGREPDTVAAGVRPTSSWRCCGASSTGWSPPGTTAPARRTASPTPRCARSAAGRPRRSPPPTSCRPGSTGSGSGRRAATLLTSTYN